MDQIDWRAWGAKKWQAFKRALPYVLRALVIGGSIAALAYWVFFEKGIYFTRRELCIWAGILAWLTVEWLVYRHAQPETLKFTFDTIGRYWTYQLQEPTNPFSPTTTRICIATRVEKDRVPEPKRAYGMQVVAKIHCIVEGEFWVWQETFPWQETEFGIHVHPNVR